jgi:hypothetical protein
VAALAIVMAGAAGFAAASCGGASSPPTSPASSPSAGATALTPGASSSRLTAPRGWGLEFEVSSEMPSTQGPFKQGDLGMMLFTGDAAQGQRDVVVVQRTRLAGGLTVRDILKELRDPAVPLSLLPGTVYQGADVAITRTAAAMPIGPGWPGARARYLVKLTPDAAASMGTDALGYEIVIFTRKGFAYHILMLGPADGFAARIAQMELTAQTMAAKN